MTYSISLVFKFCYDCAPEKAMAPHSTTLAWKIPWMEEPGRLQSMGSLEVGHDWATSLSCTGEGNGNPLQCSCLENPRDGGAWWAAVYGVAQSRTQLKRLSSSSSSNNMTVLSTVKSHSQAMQLRILLGREEKENTVILRVCVFLSTTLKWHLLKQQKKMPQNPIQ